MSKLGNIAQWSQHFPELNGRERSILRHIADCGTERMGGNILNCECGNREVHYNSCRDRHCPLCQGAARARWVKDRLKELLPCPYFHAVFTVPQELRTLAQHNRLIFYRILFSCVHNTLLTVCANKENLGARIGGMSVLHTWNQKLGYHPHIHCIIPGGGVSPDGSSWIAGNPNYLVSVLRLSVVFRGKILSTLEESFVKGELYGDPVDIRASLNKAARKRFVVYAKEPFGSPAQVVKYLGRYTHRVGISEQRIISADKTTVSFSWLDRAAGYKRKTIELSLHEFAHSFLKHMLPKAMRKIRYFGYMGNRDRTASIESVRLLIEKTGIFCKPECESQNTEQEELVKKISETGKTLCSKCGLEMQKIFVEKSSRYGAKSTVRMRLSLLKNNIHGPDPNMAAALF